MLKHTVLALATATALPSMATAGVRESSLGAWQEYARQGVMPEYRWNDTAPAAVPTVLSTLRAARDGTRVGRAGLDLRVSYTQAPAGYAPAALVPVDNLLSRERSAIQSQFIASGVSRELAGIGQFDLTAVVAHQSYASAGFGTAAWQSQEDLAGLTGSTPRELSSGHGVRLGYSTPLGAEFEASVSIQSRIDMDAFKSYRGVYSEPGDFDLPARLRSQLQWNATPDVAVAFGVERVLYSEISAFTSSALPTRLLSLLGDGSSPEFAWRDLTVYSLEGAVVDASGAQWSLRYTTSQQPLPTSRLLQRAMNEVYSNDNWAFGYRRGFGGFGSLWLAASYSPTRHFLGASPFARFDFERGSQIEVEALWSIPF